jgi:hypothetical protein
MKYFSYRPEIEKRKTSAFKSRLLKSVLVSSSIIPYAEVVNEVVINNNEFDTENYGLLVIGGLFTMGSIIAGGTAQEHTQVAANLESQQIIEATQIPPQQPFQQ